MEEWKEYKLGDFMEFNPKISLKKDTVARKITMDLLVPHSRDIYSWTYEPYSGGAKFQNGDTIMARITPCLENGKHAFISLLDENEIAYGSTEYIVIRGKKGISDNLFVYYLTHFPSFKDAAIKSMVGTSGRQRAQVDVLENLTMKLPPLPEQKRIANILTRLDDKIAVNKQINDNLEQQAQALFKSWFVDFEPFRDQPFVESELGMIPEGWRVGKVGDVCKLENGFAFKSDSYSSVGNYKIITIKNVQDGYLDTNDANQLTSIPTKMPNSCNLKIGDILVSLTGNVGRCCFVTEDNLLLNQRVAKIRPYEKGNWGYLYSLFRMPVFKDRMISIARGTAQANLSPIETAKLTIIIPPSDILIRYSSFAADYYQKIISNMIQSGTIATIRDTLLPRLMSGELEVKDIEDSL